jgi:hypothetical protein
LFQPDPTNEVISKAVPYYMALLIARKLLWGFVSDQFLEERGSQPTDAEVEGTIRRCFGERGYQRAKKGRETLGSATFAADEQLVLYAFLHALLFGTETVILSGDKDIEDQFYKMQWLLDTHYRSMLFAEKWAKGEIDLPSQSLDIAGGLSRAFQGNDAIVVTGRSANLHEVLPERFTPSILYNWLVTGPAENLRMYPISLCLEQEMRRVLWMKAKTGGSNTDAMNGRNCHVWQKPLSFPGGCVVFAQDILCTGGGVVVPVLDWQHALMTDERISHIHVEDGEGMSITSE